MGNKQDVIKLIKIIESDDTKQWFTIKDLSEISGMSEKDLIEIISKDSNFLRSTHLSKDNLARFTTKKDFDEKGSVFSKVLGAFKNRID